MTTTVSHQTADEPSEEDEAPGEEVGKIWVEIDYAILQHFSKHLYTSPHKAVEELVTNGYDALAERVDVFLPGTYAAESLLVWDDGTSMDADGLKRLWWIARSPKEADGGVDRVAVSADGKRKRKMVGKFGIGKLASYAVGDRLAHLCRRGDEYLLVRVDYQSAPKLTDREDGDTGGAEKRGFSTPLLRLTEPEALELARAQFSKVPDDFDSLFAREHWTIAIVDAVKPDVTLSPGRLRWILGNGMPLRPDFTVVVDEVEVQPAALEGAFATWTLDESALQDSLRAQWKDARDDAQVSGDLTFGQNAPDAADHPGEHWLEAAALGRVYGSISLFETSLRDGRAGEHGRSEGFFVYVLDRLINPDDAKLLLSDPSFGAFNRMQAVLRADGLDADLLADRERLVLDSPSALALRAVQRGLYLAARAALEKRDIADQVKNAIEQSLPFDSRDFFRQPLTALAITKTAADGTRLNVSKARVVQEMAAEASPLMTVRPETNELVLNQGHPLYTAARRRLGDGQKGKDALRLIELLAVSDTVLHGHLLDIGVDDEVVTQVVEWRDGQIRALAVTYENRPDEIIEELRSASFEGGARFERALAQMFRLMGFVATRDGKSGEKDVLIVAPVGRSEDRFVVEAKGKREGKGAKDKLANDESEISGAAAHAAAANASFAVVVGRDFQGFARDIGDEAAVIQECRCQTPPVSIMNVDTLIALYHAVQINHYPLATIIPVLREVESPADKLDRVSKMERPLKGFDIAGLLDQLWSLQQGQQSGMPIPILQLQSSMPDWKAMDKGAFERVIYGIENITGGLLTVVAEDRAVELLQSPAIVKKAIDEASARRAEEPSSSE